MASRNFLINLNTGGRLGNQLLSFIWAMEISRLTGVIVVNPVFNQYKDWFEVPSRFQLVTWSTSKIGLKWYVALALWPFINPYLLNIYHHIRIARQWRLDEIKHWPLFAKLPNSLIGYIAFDWLVDGRHKVDKLGPTFAFKDGSPDFYSLKVLDLVRSRRFTLLDSAVLASIPASIVEEARKFFKLKAKFINVSKSFQDAAKARNETLIGVSVRQGDFRSWAGGSLFVEPEQFRQMIREILKLLGEKPYVLVICSDESIDKSIFEEFRSFYPEPGPAIHMSYLIACDYILGTSASTFIQMSSFLGNVPFYPVDQQNQYQLPSLDDFKVFGIANAT